MTITYILEIEREQTIALAELAHRHLAEFPEDALAQQCLQTLNEQTPCCFLEIAKHGVRSKNQFARGGSVTPLTMGPSSKD